MAGHSTSPSQLLAGVLNVFEFFGRADAEAGEALDAVWRGWEVLKLGGVDRSL